VLLVRVVYGDRCIRWPRFWVERHALFIAVKNFTVCGVLMWFYLVGDVNDNILLVSRLVVGMITIDVVRQGMIPAVFRKVSCAFLPFISLYLLF
jgi:hypothetical protein